MNQIQMGQNVVGRWRVVGAIRPLANTKELQLDCACNCSSIWKEKERSRIRSVQIRELCRVMKGVDERIDETVLQWRGWRVIGLLRESM